MNPRQLGRMAAVALTFRHRLPPIAVNFWMDIACPFAGWSPALWRVTDGRR